MASGQAARPPIPRRTGFSLVELMVVVALLGIILGVGVVSMSSKKPEESAAADVERCRGESIAQGVPVLIRIDTVALLCLPDGQLVGAGREQLSGAFR
ncbi:MAG: pilus assembly FimT family protein [Gemmatimonadales bacterium]